MRNFHSDRVEDLFLLGCFVASLGQRFSTSCLEEGKGKEIRDSVSSKRRNNLIQRKIVTPPTKF